MAIKRAKGIQIFKMIMDHFYLLYWNQNLPYFVQHSMFTKVLNVIVITTCWISCWILLSPKQKSDFAGNFEWRSDDAVPFLLYRSIFQFPVPRCVFIISLIYINFTGLNIILRYSLTRKTQTYTQQNINLQTKPKHSK